MSNPVDYIETYPERTKRLLGISYQQWKELTIIAIAYDKQQQEKLESSKVRINAKGGGRKPLLKPTRRRDWFMFILFKANANL